MKKVTGGGLPAETWKAIHAGRPSWRPGPGLPLGGPVPPVSIEGPMGEVGDPVAGLVRDLAPVPVSRDQRTGAGETARA
jgi:penicillin-binding protein 1A